jgi:hypothetical protein
VTDLFALAVPRVKRDMDASYLLGDAVNGMPLNIPPVPAALPAVGLHHSCCREILRLNSENTRLHDELTRIRAQYEDLTKSAELWIRLYETSQALRSGRYVEGPNAVRR